MVFLVIWFSTIICLATFRDTRGLEKWTFLKLAGWGMCIAIILTMFIGWIISILVWAATISAVVICIALFMNVSMKKGWKNL